MTLGGFDCAPSQEAFADYPQKKPPVTLANTRQEGGTWGTYQLDPVVPEPTSILLLATVIVGVVIHTSRRDVKEKYR